MPPSRIPTARRFPQQRRNASMGGRPQVTPRRLPFDISPMTLPGFWSSRPLDVYRYDQGYMNLYKSAKAGRVVVEYDDKLGVGISVGQLLGGEGMKVWSALHRTNHTPAELRARTFAETRALELKLYEAVLEIYESFKIPVQGPIAPDEDDPYGDIATLGALGDVIQKLRENESFVTAVAKLADRPELGLPHPVELEAALLSTAFINRAMGKQRTPVLMSGGPRISAPSNYQRDLAKTMHRHEGPHFETLGRTDLLVLMQRLGWDGKDHRCEAGGGSR
ncbi:MAG: hypothetical protein JNK04_04580 [Myxococcales bacterium]|nr:hypothetical protein [Myxococcales bacterium]